jgi:hypothetical protein
VESVNCYRKRCCRCSYVKICYERSLFDEKKDEAPEGQEGLSPYCCEVQEDQR